MDRESVEFFCCKGAGKDLDEKEGKPYIYIYTFF